MAGTVNINSHQDDNQVYSIIGVQGTLGTADTKGTAKTLPIAVDPTTGAMYVNDLSGGGAAGGTTVTVDHGSVAVTAGTITAGTVIARDTLAPYAFDTIAAAYPDGTTETYTYKTGTTPVGTITVTYTDSTKGSVSSVVRT